MKPVCLIFLSLFFISSCDKKESSKTSTPPAAQQDNADCEKYQLQDFVADQSHIIGGSRVLPTDADAKATVMIISTEKGTGQSFICTATPITSRTLITAAHCLDRAAQVTAVFYVDLLCSSGFKFSRDAIRAVDFTWHPDYDPNVMNSSNPDMGLVHLSADIKPGYQIYNINLAPETLNSELLLYGYGITGSNNSDSTVLRKVNLSSTEYTYEQQSMIINSNGARGICLGDSGGPGLVTSGQELQIATVNSFGYGPRNDVCGGRASLILIHPFISWVHRALEKWNESLPIQLPNPTRPAEPLPVIAN
jgi:hypothetical protein